MSYKIAALYQFASLPDFRELREPLRALCASQSLKGSILLATEGINGTVAGPDDGIDALIEDFRHGPLFGGRLDRLELKFSRARDMPFGRMKVRLKKEIVKGGILKYLEDVPQAESRWRGECFVFDERVALGHGLRERNSVSDD
jgi:UPF0176 protein